MSTSDCNKKEHHGPEEMPPEPCPSFQQVARNKEKTKSRSSRKQKSSSGQDKRKKKKNKKNSSLDESSTNIPFISEGADRVDQTAPTTILSAETLIFPGAVQVDGPHTHSVPHDTENPAAANPPEEEELAVAAYVTESHQFISDLSSSIVYGEPMSKRNMWLIAIAVLLAILIAAVIAVAVVLTQKNVGGNEYISSATDSPPTPIIPTSSTETGPPATGPSNSNVPTTTTIPAMSPPPTPSPIIVSTAPTVPSSTTFDFEQRHQDMSFTAAGGYLLTDSSDTVFSLSSCASFCAEYDALRFASSVVGDMCICYTRDTAFTDHCANLWGSSVDTSAVARGSILSKQPFAACSEDFCTVSPNDILCFTGNEIDLQEYSLTMDGGYMIADSSDLVNSELACLGFCAEYEAVRWASSVDGDRCVCYAPLALFEGERCAMPWGNSVDANSYIALGSVFSKQPFSTCNVDYCTAQPDRALCFTANELNWREYTLVEAGGYEIGVIGASASSEADCRTFCATYDAMRWASGAAAASKCVCYSLIESFEGEPCATRWGDKVTANFNIVSGSVFSKQPFATCNVDYCTVQPDDGICFTANTLLLQDYTITEAGGYEVGATAAFASSEAECLGFCATYDVMYWASTADVKCVCYSPTASFQGKRCATPWGDAVNTNFIASGTVFSKQPLAACNADFCDTYRDTSYFCLTANEANDSAFVSANGLVPASGTIESQEDSEIDCLQACGSFTAAEYNFLASSFSCRCFETVDCLAVDSGGQSVVGRSLFLKDQPAACSESLCTLAPDHELCS